MDPIVHNTSDHIDDIPEKRIARYQVPVMEMAAAYGALWRNSIPPAMAFMIH
jgi:hypothetical protein